MTQARVSVPVRRYRFKDCLPVSSVKMDREIVSRLEDYALADLYLEYGEHGNVLLSKKFFDYKDHRQFKKKIPLENFLLGIPEFQANQHCKKRQLVFLDGDTYNYCRNNLILFCGL